MQAWAAYKCTAQKSLHKDCDVTTLRRRRRLRHSLASRSLEEVGPSEKTGEHWEVHTGVYLYFSSIEKLMRYLNERFNITGAKTAKILEHDEFDLESLKQRNVINLCLRTYKN